MNAASRGRIRLVLLRKYHEKPVQSTPRRRTSRISYTFGDFYLARSIGYWTSPSSKLTPTSLAVRNSYSHKEVKSADVLMDGVVWEMKSPTSASVKSLQKVLRRAGRQSHNVIVDTARMRGRMDRAAQRELARLLPLVASVRRLRLGTKARDAFDVT